MSKEAKARVLASPLGKFARTAWKPVVVDGDNGGPSASKYGGIAWLKAGEQWPACPSCKQPMHLVVQLDLAKVPAQQLGGRGLMQFFACTSSEPNCEVATEAFFPQTGAKKPRAKLLRVVDGHGVCGSPAAVPAMPKPMPAKTITKWMAVQDFPLMPSEVEIEGELEEGLAEVLHDACEGGDKLCGWPKWVQDLEYPACAKCGEEMRNFAYQLTSDAENGCSFCGDGVAYVCQCTSHPDQVDELAQQ